ncbi:MAG: Sir2 family NAD-dependent protein deacetylase [Bacteroidota bacterium]
MNKTERKKIVVLTGAGISKESGIPTYRGSDGLWEGYDVNDVASPAGWAKNPELVLEFYKLRRESMLSVEPNEGHKALVDLEKHFDVEIITQNIDNLHEQAGSSEILHLHGTITQVRSTGDPDLVYELDDFEQIGLGDVCDKGFQLRPNIVWFGEDVPAFGAAMHICSTADIVLIIGTSMVVYPANTLIKYAPDDAEVYIIDPNIPEYDTGREVNYVEKPASVGVREVADLLIERVTGIEA